MNTFTIFFLIALSQVFAQMSDNFIHHPRNLGIINGKEVRPHSLPYQVAIVSKDTAVDLCGGSLISNQYVLTAAHCLDGVTRLGLIFGAHNLVNSSEAGRVILSVNRSNFIVHPHYSQHKVNNDIALIKLVAPIKTTNHINTIKLAGNYAFNGSQGIVAGWGKIDNNYTPSKVLLYIVNTIMTNKDCKAVDHRFNTLIQPTNICLLGKIGRTIVSTCNGDSGSPLVVDGMQVGVSAFGDTDCLTGNPSVFTRVSSYAGWIRNKSGI